MSPDGVNIAGPQQHTAGISCGTHDVMLVRSRTDKLQDGA